MNSETYLSELSNVLSDEIISLEANERVLNCYLVSYVTDTDKKRQKKTRTPTDSICYIQYICILMGMSQFS